MAYVDYLSFDETKEHALGVYSPTAIKYKTIKSVILGDSGVGKTSFFNRTKSQDIRNLAPTIGADLAVENYYIKIENMTQEIRLNLWDTAGQEKFEAITQNYMRGAQIFWLVYDLSAPTSFQHLHRWFDKLVDFCKENGSGDQFETCAIHVIANKSDLRSEQELKLDEERLEELCKELVAGHPKKAVTHSIMSTMLIQPKDVQKLVRRQIQSYVDANKRKFAFSATALPNTIAGDATENTTSSIRLSGDLSSTNPQPRVLPRLGRGPCCSSTSSSSNW
jgi:small GTP-binding protein